MKLSDLRTKLTSMKGKAVRVLAATALAGAVLTAVPAAKAQRFSFGVQVGTPGYAGYVAPVPPPAYYTYPAYGYGYGYNSNYWAARRYDDWRAREAWARHEQWERYNRGYGYGGYGYRR
jgi:hypothetical protein